jgi:hypothetical protein
MKKIDCVIVDDDKIQMMSKGEVVLETDRCEIILRNGKFPKVVNHAVKPDVRVFDFNRHTGAYTCPVCGLTHELKDRVNEYCSVCGQYLEASIVPGEMKCQDCPNWKHENVSFDIPYCGLSGASKNKLSFCESSELNIIEHGNVYEKE